MSDEKQTIEQVNGLVEKLRDVAEKSGKDSAAARQIAEDLSTKMDKFEESNQKAVKAHQDALEKSEEVDNRLAAMEDQLTRSSTKASGNYKDTTEYKALNEFARFGREILEEQKSENPRSLLSDEEAAVMRKALMRTDNNEVGGFLTSVEQAQEMLKIVEEISPVRQFARVRTISRKTLEMPKRKTIPTARYEGEAATAKKDGSTYGAETITALRQTVTIPFTHDMLLDSAFDIEAEINEDVALGFAKNEGNRYLLGEGPGSKQPEGILKNAGVIANAYEGAVSGKLSPDDLIKVTANIKEGYNPMFAFNRKTLVEIMTMKDNDDRYLWQAGLAPGAANTIAGQMYTVMQDMPDIAANALAVLYGDLRRGYLVVDRQGMVVIRDEVTRKDEAIIELNFHRFNTGQVVLEEAFAPIKIKA